MTQSKPRANSPRRAVVSCCGRWLLLERGLRAIGVFETLLEPLRTRYSAEEPEFERATFWKGAPMVFVNLLVSKTGKLDWPAPSVTLWSLGLVVAASLSAATADEGLVDYRNQVKPLLRDKCFSCHSALQVEGGLRLDAISLILQGGETGPGIVPGSVSESLLLQRVAAEDSERMPPEGEGSRLTEEEIHLLTRWVESGAKAPEESIPEDPSRHWAFQPPTLPQVPDVQAGWIRTDLDRFLAQEHQRLGVQAVGEVSPSLLLRRVSLALTGLPPTPEELESFLDDTSEDAYENAVDRLLASPRYGERWARHFMDIWRYSDPSGYGDEIRDGRKHIWRWRDWIVESLNDDKSYDQMVREMLAADELNPGDESSLRATGFLARNWYKFNRNVWLDNIVEHSSKAFLGLTVNCARCHSHKYDPFQQVSYYRMRAIFETHDVRDDSMNVDTTVEPAVAPGTLVRAYDAHLDRPTYLFEMGDENRPVEQQALEPGLPDLLGELHVEPIDLPLEVWYPAMRPASLIQQRDDAERSIRDAENKLASAQKTLEASKKTLAEFKVPEAQSETQDHAASELGKPILTDDFAKLDLDRWTVESGEWEEAEGRLVQTNGATAQHRLVSRSEHPRDFHLLTRFRITGGETYKSVGVGFDVHEQAMKAVYLSVSGPKVQYTRQGMDARWEYPAAGMATMEVKVGQDYQLELLVKDQLLNIRVDGELKVACDLGERKPGQFSVWAFSATAEFDELEIRRLPDSLKLVPSASNPSSKPRVVTRQDLQLGVEVAEAAYQSALANLAAERAGLAALLARIDAELVKYERAEGDREFLAQTAGEASRKHIVAQFAAQWAEAQEQLAQARRDQKPASDREALQKKIEDLATKRDQAATEVDNGSENYEPLGPQYPKTSSGRRLAFARWVTDRHNPLTARVLVNHVWMRHFERPLVERTFDFGLRSPKPQHAELLDWLALQWMDQGWSLKQLHKVIVMSGAYRLNSSPLGANAETLRNDPDNTAYWRSHVRRMDAEAVRDSVLALGESLDETLGGAPISHDQGQTVLRRSLYFRQDKERQMTFLSLFDGAKVNECYERKATVVPQQALAMFNSQLVADQARKIADRYAEQNPEAFVNALFRHVLCRGASQKEQDECVQFLNEFEGSAEARYQLTLVLLNHNDFVTIR